MIRNVSGNGHILAVLEHLADRSTIRGKNITIFRVFERSYHIFYDQMFS